MQTPTTEQEHVDQTTAVQAALAELETALAAATTTTSRHLVAFARDLAQAERSVDRTESLLEIRIALDTLTADAERYGHPARAIVYRTAACAVDRLHYLTGWPR